MIDSTVFLSKTTFSEYIERQVISEGFNHLEAIIEFQAESDKTAEELLPFMSQVLIDKVRLAASDMGLMSPMTTLDDLLE